MHKIVCKFAHPEVIFFFYCLSFSIFLVRSKYICFTALPSNLVSVKPPSTCAFQKTWKEWEEGMSVDTHTHTHTQTSRHAVFGTFRNSGYDIRPSVENHRKRRQESPGILPRRVEEEEGVWSGMREEKPGCEGGCIKGESWGRGRSEIDTAREESLAIPAISSRELRNFHSWPREKRLALCLWKLWEFYLIY